MPTFLGRPVIAWAEKHGKLDAYNVGMHIKTSGVFGYLLVRSLAWLRPLAADELPLRRGAGD